jgi:hypothetical protein
MGGSVMAVVINGTTGIDKVQDGSIGTADIAADAITTPKIASSVNLGRRNLIINGDMAISQRSTSVSSLTGTGYKTVDRIRVNGSGGTYNQSQQTVTVGGETGLPVQFTKFLRHECTVGNDNHILMNRTEDVSKFVGTMKLSFYAKGSGADVLAVKFHQGFGSGGSSDIYTSAQSFTVTSSWQRFEFDIVMPSITGKTVGAGNFGSVLFGQDLSTSTAAWTLDITGLQWEHGDTATPFEHRSYGEELVACQRYFVRVGADTGTDYNFNMRGLNCVLNGTFYNSEKFPTTMRAGPTVSIFNANNSRAGNPTATSTSINGMRLDSTCTATGMGYYRYCYTADAEL